jgi:hypothetical protein
VKYIRNIIIVFILFLTLSQRTVAQTQFEHFLTPSTQFNQGRFTTVVIGQALFYTTTMYLLNRLWYKKHSNGHFHAFNDNKEWLQMDKAGHFTTAYNMSRIMAGTYAWSGLDQKNSVLLGSGFAMLFLSTVEIFDGFSNGWGFSTGDMAANILGTGLFMGQQYMWNGQRITVNVSYNKSIYAIYRPDELGSSWKEKIFKDYNAQTYWLSANIASFVNAGPNFPQWLNVTAGYGANGMTGGHANPEMKDKEGNPVTFERYRQYYLSLGTDFTRIGSNSPYFKAVAPLMNIYKLPPFPTLEYNRVDGFKGHVMYTRF